MFSGMLLRKLRVASGLTQTELAYRLNVFTSHIAHIELDDFEPSSTLVKSLCKEFNVDEDAFQSPAVPTVDATTNFLPVNVEGLNIDDVTDLLTYIDYLKFKRSKKQN